MRRVPLLLALGSVLSGLAFFADLKGYFKPDPRPIAFLRESEGTVRRLAKGHLSWDRMGPGAVFGLGDTVSTVGFSRARLMFFAGGELSLGPDSMVILTQELEKVRVDQMLGAGRVQITDKATERLLVGDSHPSQVTLGRQFNVPRAIGAGKAGYPVFRATSISEKSLRRPASAGSDHVQMVSSGSLPPAPRILGPLDHSVMELTPGGAISLDWSGLGEPPSPPVQGKKTKGRSTQYEVRLTQLEGGGTVRTFRVAATSLRLTKLQSGTYRWSVRAITPDGRRSPASPSRWLEIRSLVAEAGLRPATRVKETVR